MRLFQKLYLFSFLFILLNLSVNAQQIKSKKFSFYGGFGFNIGLNYTYISLQPGLLYNLHPKFKIGAGVQYIYLSSNSLYFELNNKYHIFGYNTLALYQPLKELEVSAEFENLYVQENHNDLKNTFWSPSLFAGVGYRFGPVVAGFKYNFLFYNGPSVYQDAFTPYVRFYF